MFESFLAMLLLVSALGTVVETDWIEVFRAGDYPQGEFSEEDVEDLAEVYDPDGAFEAPVTTDHRQKGPAFGWVKGLKAEAGKLYAKFRQVSKDFAESINEGLFKNRSVEIFREGVVGDGQYLKAVSFLGAKAPQVKDLESIGSIEFSEEQLASASAAFAYSPEDDTEEFQDEEDGKGAEGEGTGGEVRSIIEDLQEEADMTLSDIGDEVGRAESTMQGISSEEIENPPAELLEDLRQLKDSLDLSHGSGGSPSGEQEGDGTPVADTFAELREEVARLQAEVQQTDQERRRAERRAQQAEQSRREEALDSFMEERVPPAIRPRAKALFEALEQDHLSFEHAPEEVEEDPVACFKALLKELAHEELFEEFAGGPAQPDGSAEGLEEAVRSEMAANGLQ